MSPEEHELIFSLARAIAPKYAFAHYSKEDLIQEAYIMGMDAYQRWDRTRPLENFIARHMSNRLKTLKRNKFYRSGPGGEVTDLQKRKRSLVQPSGIDKAPSTGELPDPIGLSEFDDIVPIMYRRDFLRMVGGARVSSSIRAKIIEICQGKLES